MKVEVKFHRNCVFSFQESKYIFWGQHPLNPLREDYSHVMNKLWYVMGDAGCREVSSELCVSFEEKANTGKKIPHWKKEKKEPRSK